MKRLFWFVLNVFFTVTYLVWRIFFTIPFKHGWVSVAAGIVLLVIEILGMVEAFVHYANMSSEKKYPLPDVPEELYPHVDIFIATYSEECELLYKTINGCKYMDYPDKSKVHIYLCDDNRRPEMRALAEKMGVNYLDRPDNRGAKAGNLNNALKHSNSPYLVTFDADMIPKRDFLMKTIPYFVDCERKNKGREEEEQVKLGFLQSPQCFYNPDLFQFNLFSEGRIPNEQDYFYRDIQVARTGTNSVIYGGSNTVIAREAIEAVGGFYTEAITEDFATGILIERKGYVSLAIAEPLASGMSATDLKGLVQQRVRWARGVIATGRKMHIYTAKDLSFAQKMNYWASIWYWYAPLKRLVYVLSPLLYATFGFMVFKCTLPEVLLFWLPMYISSNISLKMLSNNIRTTKWTGIYEMVLFPFMLIPVLLESVGITLKKFKVTDKSVQQNNRGQNLIYMIPFLIMIVITLIGLIKCVSVMFDSGSFSPIVVMFWLLNNLFLLAMSLFFVDGRVPYRKSERVPIEIECVVSNGIFVIDGVTKDISETGISVLLNQPYYFPVDALVEISLKTEMYQAKVNAQVIYVKQQKHNWAYSLKILDYQDTYNEYLQMLYDRVPVMPTEIKKDSGSFEDLKLNAQKRIIPPFFQKRKYPRILLNIEVDYYLPEQMDQQKRLPKSGMKAKGKLVLYDFDYCYVSLQPENISEAVVLKIFNDVFLHCVYEGNSKADKKLYRICDMEAVMEKPAKMKRMLEWLTKTNAEALEQQRAMEQQRKIEKKAEKLKKDFDETDLV